MDIERRSFALDSLKIERREKELTRIVGHAAVFNRDTEIMKGFLERIAPGAFTRAIAEDDVAALFNHDDNIVLGRRSAGTLKMAEDTVGLAVDITPPDTQLVRDMVLSPIDRRDVHGMSIGFVVRDRRNDQIFEEINGIVRRTILRVQLMDVSPVTFPAFPQTDVALRSLDDFRNEAKELAETARRALGLTTQNAAAAIRRGIKARLSR